MKISDTDPDKVVRSGRIFYSDGFVPLVSDCFVFMVPPLALQGGPLWSSLIFCTFSKTL